MRRLVWLGVVMVWTGICHGQTFSSRVIVNRNCYWRQYYRFKVPRFRPELMKVELARIQKSMGGRRFTGMKQNTEKQMRREGLDPGQVDWREHVRLANSGAREFSPTPAPIPPDDWTAVDFDDGAWVRERGVFQGGARPG